MLLVVENTGSPGFSSPKCLLLWLPQVSFPSVSWRQSSKRHCREQRESEWKHSQIVANGWEGLSLIISKCRQQVKIRKWGDRSRWGRKGEGGGDESVPCSATGSVYKRTELLSVAVTLHNDASVWMGCCLTIRQFEPAGFWSPGWTNRIHKQFKWASPHKHKNYYLRLKWRFDPISFRLNIQMCFSYM